MAARGKRLDWFLIGLVAMPVIASLFPVRDLGATIVEHATTVAVCLLFFLHGAKLSPSEAAKSFANWRFQLLVFGATFVLFPVLGVGFSTFGGAFLSPELVTGLVFVSILPSTVQSSIAFTSMARGNVGLAVSSASLSNMVGVLITPLLAALLLGGAVHITGSSILGIVGQLVVPFVLGQLLHNRISPWLRSHSSVVKFVDSGSVLLVVYGAFSASVVDGLWTVVGPTELALVVAVSAVLLAVVMVVLTLVATLTKMPRADWIVLLFCGSKKSQVSGVPMATLLFPAAALGTTILPLMIFHLFQLLVCSVLARALGRKAEAA